VRLAALVCLAALSPLPSHAGLPGQAPDDSLDLRLTEREAVARFLAADPQVRALDARFDEERAVQAERTLWPNPSAIVSRETVFDGRDTFLLARQELPVTGRRSRLETAGRLAVDVARADAQADRLRLHAEVRSAYWSLLLAQQREAVLARSMGALQDLVSLLTTREEAGEGSTYERMRGQRALIDLEAERSLAAGDRARAQGRLAGYLGPGIEPETLVATDALLAPVSQPPLDTLIEQALAARGDYRAAVSAVARFEAEHDAASRLRLPTPAVTGGLKRSDVGGAVTSGYEVSVDVAIPLFSRGQAATALARTRQARAQAEADSRRLRIEADVRAAYSVLRLQRELVTRYEAAAAAIAEPLAAIGRVGYREGEISILELLDAERQALDARLHLLELAAAARQAAIDLDRVTGREIRP